MAESVPVRCPSCRLEHAFTPPTFPCPCGAALTVPVLRGGVPIQVRHRTWNDSWVTMRCPSCGRRDDWPAPEFGCGCGVTVRLPIDSSGSSRPATPAAPSAPSRPARNPLPLLRPPFHPITIRTAADTVTAAVQYLKWLGFSEVRPSEDRVRSGIDVRGQGIIAQVDGGIKPTALRDVECLWLNMLNEDVPGVFFALAGYARDARVRADQLKVALFVLDLTGTPQPVNNCAHTLIRTGARTTR